MDSELMNEGKREEKLIDMFVFKVFALLMCRGSKVEKTNHMMDLIIAQDGVK